MGLIHFEGKPVEKLIEVISQAMGTLYKPRAIRKEADAKAYKIGVIERAKANAIAESKIIDLNLLDNIQNRIIHQETLKQNNIDNVIEIAAIQLSQEHQVSEEKVESDWTTRFFNIAEDISNAEMQNLWGRILAGETKKPNSFSLRTLEALKSLTKKEAEIFTKFAKLRLKVSNTYFIPLNDKIRLEKEFDITYSQILLLTELGLISSGSTLGLVFKSTEVPLEALYENGEIGILVKTAPNKVTTSTKILVFTTIGIELSNLITNETNFDYIEYACRALSTHYTKIIFGKLANEEGKTVIKHATEYNL